MFSNGRIAVTDEACFFLLGIFSLVSLFFHEYLQLVNIDAVHAV